MEDRYVYLIVHLSEKGSMQVWYATLDHEKAMTIMERHSNKNRYMLWQIRLND